MFDWELYMYHCCEKGTVMGLDQRERERGMKSEKSTLNMSLFEVFFKKFNLFKYSKSIRICFHQWKWKGGKWWECNKSWLLSNWNRTNHNAVPYFTSWCDAESICSFLNLNIYCPTSGNMEFSHHLNRLKNEY